jgi:16S rRNA (cytosine1402-N4)-methyltransferase
MAQGPLDMRMDKSQSLTAKEVINNYSEEKLAYIIKEYGDEPFAKTIAQNICRQRELGQIKTTAELVTLIDRSLPYSYKRRIGHGAKKTFQAVRIEVNGELEGLKEITEKLIGRLKTGGRISVITFHSLEDKIIKDVFREYATNCICPKDFPICICGHRAEVKLVNKKPVEAGIKELELNSRSMSAKLRTAEKII